MRPSVDLILESMRELTKRKVKRHANVWSTRISELCSLRTKITHSHLPDISRFFLINNLLHDSNVQLILRSSLPQILHKKDLSVVDYSTLSYVYACIDEDASSETILSNNYSEESVKTSSDDNVLTFLRTLSLLLSRRIFGKLDPPSKTVSQISNDLLDFILDRIKCSDSGSMTETVQYLEFSELVLEYIFISNLLGRLDRGILDNQFIDYGSLFSMIRVSPLLSSQKTDLIVSRIHSSDNGTVLDVLRKSHYFRLSNLDFTQHLFDRLCNTSAKSSMCRREILTYLSSTLDLIDSHLRTPDSPSQDLKRLQSRLRSIQSLHALENPHRSRIRWNYPCFIA